MTTASHPDGPLQVTAESARAETSGVGLIIGSRLRQQAVGTTVALTLIAMAALTLLVHEVLASNVGGDVSGVLQDRADAVTSTLIVRDGQVVAQETPTETLDRSTWVYTNTVVFTFSIIGFGISLLTLAISHDVLGLTSRLADNISANGIDLALGTAFRFLTYKHIVFREPQAAPIASLRPLVPCQPALSHADQELPTLMATEQAGRPFGTQPSSITAGRGKTGARRTLAHGIRSAVAGT